MSRLHVALLGLAVAAACASDAGPAPTDVGPPDAAAGLRVVQADRALYAAFPTEVQLLSQPGLPTDASGLIGRNRSWGAMYAARFQMGTGSALRGVLAAGRADDIARAFRGIEAGLATIEPSGRLPATVPVSVSMGATPSEADVASGAAFFLGDACTAVLALEQTVTTGAAIEAARRRRVREQLVSAARWLRTTSAALAAADARAPNRLLFDARAFEACGALAGDQVLRDESRWFVSAAIASLRADDAFDEGGGWDTNYQAVAIDIGLDVLTVLPATSARDSLASTLSRATRWLTARVGPDGRVNSAGNRRTCAGGESFLGEPKRLSLSSVIAALAKSSVTDGTAPVDVAAAARRVSSWAQAQPTADPCFEW
ncbi:MAG: hypothetical protein SFW08_11880 [Gemmatimonadaceae bacterium]|nr:hypothetical protein [Gemmatimonadaceae bacterium]